MSEKVELEVSVEDRDLERLNVDLSKMKQETKDLMKALQDSGRALRGTSADYESFNKAARASAVPLSSYKKMLSDLAAAVRNGELRSKAFAGVTKSLSDQLAQAAKRIGDAAREHAKLGQALNRQTMDLRNAEIQAEKYVTRILALEKANNQLRASLNGKGGGGGGGGGGSEKFWLSEPFENMYRKFTRFYVLYHSFKSIVQQLQRSAASIDWDRTMPFLSPGYTERIAKAREATEGLVSKFDLQKSYALMSSFGLPMERYAETMRLVTAMAMRTGQDANYLVQSYGMAISRLSPRILDNIGIQVKLSDAYRAYRIEMGKTNGVLTEYDQKMAMAAAATKGMQSALGNDPSAQFAGTQSSLKRIMTWLEDATDWAAGKVVNAVEGIDQYFSSIESKAKRFMSGTYVETTGFAQFRLNNNWRKYFEIKDEDWKQIFGQLDQSLAEAMVKLNEEDAWSGIPQRRLKYIQDVITKYRDATHDAFKGYRQQAEELKKQFVKEYGDTLSSEDMDRAVHDILMGKAQDMRKNVMTWLTQALTNPALGEDSTYDFNGTDMTYGTYEYVLSMLFPNSQQEKFKADVKSKLVSSYETAVKIMTDKKNLESALQGATDAKYLFDLSKAETPLDQELMRTEKAISVADAALKDFIKTMDDARENDAFGSVDTVAMRKKADGMRATLTALYEQRGVLSDQKRLQSDIVGITEKLNDRVNTTKNLSADALKQILEVANSIEFVWGNSTFGKIMQKVYLGSFLKPTDTPRGSGSGSRNKKGPSAAAEWLRQAKEDLHDFMGIQQDGSLVKDFLGENYMDKLPSDAGLFTGMPGLLGAFGGLGSDRSKMEEWQKQFDDIETAYGKVYRYLDAETKKYVNEMMDKLYEADRSIDDHIDTLMRWSKALTGVGDAMKFMRSGMDASIEGGGANGKWTQQMFGSDVLNVVDGMTTSISSMNDALGKQDEAYGLVTGAAPAMRAFTKELGANLRQQAILEMLMNGAAAWAAGASGQWEKAAMHIAAASMYGLVAAKVIHLPSRSSDSRAGAGSTSRNSTEIHVHIQGDIVQTEAERGVMVNRALSAARAEGAI